MAKGKRQRLNKIYNMSIEIANLTYSISIISIKGTNVLLNVRCRRVRDHMVVGFTTTCAISAYHH